jgi:hypothetical protein
MMTVYHQPGDEGGVVESLWSFDDLYENVMG